MMRFPSLHLRIIAFIVVWLAAGSQAIALTMPKSDILLHIVTQCVDPSKKDYCANCLLPRADSACSEILECKKTNEVWALTTKYAAIRDIKMCGCPASFVHGLAMPRDVITGVEDANREEGIWQFAWDVGLERIELDKLALVVNPKAQRTQNQLHVHLLRLDQHARNRFSQYSPQFISDLKQVWSVAEKMAKSQGLNDYGVLVAKEPSGQFLIIVMPDSPEGAFTVWNCQ